MMICNIFLCSRSFVRSSRPRRVLFPNDNIDIDVCILYYYDGMVNCSDLLHAFVRVFPHHFVPTTYYLYIYIHIQRYLIIDCPGQIELYTHIPVMNKIIDQ